MIFRSISVTKPRGLTVCVHSRINVFDNTYHDKPSLPQGYFSLEPHHADDTSALLTP